MAQVLQLPRLPSLPPAHGGGGMEQHSPRQQQQQQHHAASKGLIKATATAPVAAAATKLPHLHRSASKQQLGRGSKVTGGYAELAELDRQIHEMESGNDTSGTSAHAGRAAAAGGAGPGVSGGRYQHVRSKFAHAAAHYTETVGGQAKQRLTQRQDSLKRSVDRFEEGKRTGSMAAVTSSRWQ